MKPSAPQRNADNLIYYLEQLIHRVGPDNGRITATRHNGKVAKVEITNTSVAGQRPGTSPQRRPRPHTLNELGPLFQSRLDRLLRCMTCKFGDIQFIVRASKIVKINFIIPTRRSEFAAIVRFFGRRLPQAGDDSEPAVPVQLTRRRDVPADADVGLAL